MDDTELPSNKIFGNTIQDVKNENKNLDHPIKKCHFLEGKYFTVIDESIVEQLNFFWSEISELYFQQEVTEDGCIILRPYKMSD
jgi:hypothetical protein